MCPTRGGLEASNANIPSSDRQLVSTYLLIGWWQVPGKIIKPIPQIMIDGYLS